MAYVCVSGKTIKEADDLRQLIIKGAIDFAAGRITPAEFDNIRMTYGICCDYTQPASADHRKYILHRLRNFYPVAVHKADDGCLIEYRHNRLPKRKRVDIPDGLLDGLLPFKIGLEDVSGKGWELKVDELRSCTLIGSGPHHLTVEWEAK